MKAIFIFFVCLLAVESLQAQNFTSKTHPLAPQTTEKLRQLGQKLQLQQENEKARAIQAAQQNGWIIKKNTSDGRLVELQKISAYGTPLYYTTYNLDAANTSGAAELWTGGRAGLQLNGELMTLGVWDGDAVRGSHQEFGSRVITGDGSRFTTNTSGSAHASHVAGTLVAAGVSPQARGMAPAANLRSYNWNLDEAEMTAFAAAGFLISNHSYGYSTEQEDGWSDWRFGYYDHTAAEWDEIASSAPHYLIVKASGNDLNDGKNTSQNGYDLLEGAGTAKNVLVVGAVNDLSTYTGPSSVNLAGFSSTGPTDDGRIKPDLVGNGVSVRSVDSRSNTAYQNLSGTSMAAPNVSGSAILLQQHYQNLNSTFMQAATLRGLLIHTAKEAGPSPGPDYRYGWGLVDVEAAADVITNNGENTLIEEHTLNNGEAYQKVVLADGLSPLVVTICWADPKGTPLEDDASSLNNTTPLLVNNLNVKLTRNTSTFLPWKLNPQNPDEAASKGINFRDNVEKVEINNPSYGEYTITIDHSSFLSGGKQDFSIIVSGVVPGSCSPVKPANFEVSNVTDQSAIVSWDPILGVNNYEGRYREKGTSVWTTFNTANNSYTLTNLLAGTVYQIEMQALCSAVNISEFSEPFQFQTDCRADIPQNIVSKSITTTRLHLAWDTVRAVASYTLRYKAASASDWSHIFPTASSATLQSLTPGQTYEVQVKSHCSSEEASSYSLSSFFTPYCLTAPSDGADNEWIERVQIGTIDHHSGQNNGYENFTHLSTPLEKGSQATLGLEATQEKTFPMHWTVWIDFNQNGLLSDPGEQVISSPAEANILTSHTFSIPTSARNGNTLMRVTLKYNANADPCENYDHGETEDYTIRIEDETDRSLFVPIVGKNVNTSREELPLLSIYPNPSSTEISLNLSASLAGSKVSVIDMSGHTVFSSPFKNRLIVDVSHLKRGVYLVRVETSTYVQVKRFMKI